jgi:hypothetical protein
MVGMATRAIAAEVIDMQTVRDRALDRRVHQPMCKPLSIKIGDDAIAFGLLAARPNETAANALFASGHHFGDCAAPNLFNLSQRHIDSAPGSP